MLMTPALLAPSLLMAIKLRRPGGMPARRRLLVVWPVQVAAAMLLCLVADLAGSVKPEIYAPLISALVCVAGPALMWLGNRRHTQPA